MSATPGCGYPVCIANLEELAELLTGPQIEANGLSPVCDPETGAPFFVNAVFDEEKGVWTYTNTDGEVVVNGTDFVPCPDVPSVTTQFCDSANPDQTWTRVMCKKNGALDPTATAWINDLTNEVLADAPATVIRCEENLDEFKDTCATAVVDLPTTLLASGLNPALNLNQTGTGVTNWLDTGALFDGDNTTFSGMSIDNTNGQSNGLNANTFTFDMSDIPECAEIEGEATIKVYAQMNNIIGDGGYDAIWASFTGANGPIAPTSVASGTQGVPYGNAYVFMGTPDNTYIVSNGIGPVGGADYYEFTVPITVADLLAGGVQIGTDNDEPNVDGGDPELAGVEIDVTWNTDNCEEGEGGCALRTKGCNDDRRDDLLLEIAANTSPVEECAVEVTSEPQCLDGDQTLDMLDGSTRTLTDGDYITIVQFFDCKGTLVNILYYETANPDVAMASIPVTANCEPAPQVSERCLIDTNGEKWIATEYRDEDGIIVGTPFYLEENGVIGTPAGNPSDWKSCEELGSTCENPIRTSECPPPVCPPPSLEIFCDTDTGTKYVIVTYASEVCGTNGTYEAEGYFADEQVLTTFEPASAPMICEDAAVKESKCITDECGKRWSCVTTINTVNGQPIESETCVAYIAPECPEESAEGERSAKELKRKAISASFGAVKSIKLSVAVINTTLSETADPVTHEIPSPVGETCPCPCPNPTQDAMLEKLCAIADALVCEDTETVTAKKCLLAFDYDRGLVQSGETSAFGILLDGVSQSTVVHDYTTTSDGTNVSTYYDPVIAAVNAVPGWSMVLVTDVNQSDQGKPQWEVSFTGTGPSELTIQYASSVGSLGSSDAYIFSVDASGVMTTSVLDGGSPAPDYNSPVFSDC